MRRAPIAVLAAALVMSAAAAVPAHAGELRLRPVGDTSRLETERLSDERTVTRWAHPYLPWAIRARPDAGARRVGRIHFRTEDGPLEVYLLLRSRRTADDRVWLQIRVPGRPNGRKGWVRREALGPMHSTRKALVIDRGRLRATLYRAGRRIWTSPVGIGAPSTPTPAGRFWVRNRLRALGGIYGPWAFGTAAYSVLSEWPGGGVIGIHGTNQPGLIPGRPSHGCIRVPNWKIEQLVRLMPVGTPIHIR